MITVKVWIKRSGRLVHSGIIANKIWLFVWPWSSSLASLGALTHALNQEGVHRGCASKSWQLRILGRKSIPSIPSFVG